MPNATEQWTPSFNPWLIAASVMLATFMEVLDTSVANVALPHIAGNLSATPEEATWVLTSYLVSNAIVLPAANWFGRYFGRKRFLIVCIVLFTLSSALCGAAASLGLLIVARIAQGAGGGALQPIAQAVLMESFPREKRGSAMAVFGLGVVVAPIIGPTLGGWITDNYSWRWIFYINIPIGILAIFMANTFVEDPPYIRDQRPGRIDYLGFGLMALALGTMQLVLDKGQEDEWFASSFITGFAILSGAALIAFIIWELRSREPIVDLRVLVNRPRGFGAVTSMLIVGRLINRVRGRYLVMFGFSVLAYSIYLFSKINLEISISSIVWPNIISGFAMGFVFVPLTTMALGTLNNEQMGNASGVFNLMRNTGGSVGIAAVTTLLARGMQTHQAALVSHLTPYDPAFQERIRQLAGGFAARGGSAVGTQQAYAGIYGTLVRQAAVLSYIDVFRVLSFLCLLCIPATLLFERVKKKTGSVAMH